MGNLHEIFGSFVCLFLRGMMKKRHSYKLLQPVPFSLIYQKTCLCLVEVGNLSNITPHQLLSAAEFDSTPTAIVTNERAKQPMGKSTNTEVAEES